MILTETAYQAANDFTLDVVASRTSGVGPLGVSFNVVDASVFNDEDTLMLAEFMWDFGDNGTANGTGEDDEYNIGKGYAVAHVYRETGTYTATCTAYYKNFVKTETVEITVESVDDQVDWATYYVSADGLDTNDGLSESTPLLTPKTIIESATTNTRILLRQGDTFTKSESISVGGGYLGGDRVQGPIIISSYEDSGSPSDEKPVIYDDRTDVANSNSISLYNCEDIRFINIKVQCPGDPVATRDTSLGYPSGFGLPGDDYSDFCLFLDCDVQGTGTNAFLWDGQYNIMQDCTIKDAGSYGLLSGITYDCAVIGNSMKEFGNDSPEYTVRLTGHVVRTYVAYNDLYGDYTKSTFQIRGDDSSYNYIWNNQIDRFAGANQTNDELDQTLHRNTFDSNIIVARDYDGNTSGSYQDTGFYLSSNLSMFRNNIVYGFSVGLYFGENAIVGGCKKGWAHNNTIIANRSGCKCFSVRQSCHSIHARGNIFYNSSTDTVTSSDRFLSTTYTGNYGLPATGLDPYNFDYNIFISENWADVATWDIVAVSYGTSANLSEWQSLWGNGYHSLFADALLNQTIDTDDVTTSLNNGFAQLQEGSPAIGAGDPDRLWTRFDFNGNERTTNDMGALIYEG